MSQSYVKYGSVQSTCNHDDINTLQDIANLTLTYAQMELCVTSIL